jgi:type I restriction enzyme S subunit
MSDTWPTETIGDLFDIGAGKSVTPAARHGEPKHPFLRTSNVFWGRMDLSEVDSMHFTKDEIASKSLRKGDLLVCEGGDIGRAAIWNGELTDCCFQNHIHRLRSKHDNIVPRFYMYYLQSGFTQLGIYEGAGNKTTIPNLSRNRLSALSVPKPDETEQKKIAALLWKVQRAIEVEEKLIATARELKQSAMSQLFTRGLQGVAQKETDIGPVPENWRVDRLVEFAHFQRGYDITKKGQTHGTVPVVSSGGIRSWHDVAAASGPGVVIGRKGSIGTVHYVEQDFWPHDTTLFATDFCGNVPLFVYYRLCVLDLKRLDSGAANPALNRNFLHEELISWPNADEQRDIAFILQTIDRKISLHKSKCATLQELFQTLLHKLMTGEIRVADLDIDVSEVTQ